MSKSATIRVDDVRAIVKLVGECRDLGDDWSAWQRHALDGLLRLTDSDLSIGGEVGGGRGPKLVYLSPPVFHGQPGFEVDAEAIGRVIYEVTIASDASRFVDDYITRWREDDGVALTNSELYADREWRSSFDMQTIGAVAGTDATLLCCREIASGEVEDFTLFREAGRRPFSARDRAIVREVAAALVPLMGGPLARFGEPSASDLPPRAREVLACLLEGDGDKQVAARLRISPHTVNQYTKGIYRHFGVQSRPELLARWIRRGWTTRPPNPPQPRA